MTVKKWDRFERSSGFLSIDISKLTYYNSNGQRRVTHGRRLKIHLLQHLLKIPSIRPPKPSTNHQNKGYNIQQHQLQQA
jgi:hypothetical protein